MPYVIASVVMFSFTLWCVLDVVLTDAMVVRNLPKLGWLVFVIVLPVIGGIAWIVGGRPEHAAYAPGSTRSRTRPPGRPSTRGGSGRGGPGRGGPSRGGPGRGRGRVAPPKGPDDDPAFLRALEERLRREAEDDA